MTLPGAPRRCSSVAAPADEVPTAERPDLGDRRVENSLLSGLGFLAGILVIVILLAQLLL
ncbi:MAG: hypothetical protein HRU75_05965 [Planctomycetia bacterium]|nr:MAG: hypothetical protein HRU75_05965 [Planctomycetia bacterium]